MTTVPKRLRHTTAVLARLLSYQSQEPDVVVLNVPRAYASKALGRVVIPPELAALIKRDPRIVLNRRCPDLGPGTKLAGLADLGNTHAIRPQDLIVYLDDDQAYHRHTLRRHGDAHRTNPRHVFCSRGSVLGKGGSVRAAIHQPPMARVDVVEGWGAVSVLAKHVDLHEIKQQLEDARNTPALFFSDDVLLSNYFSSKGLTLRLLPTPTQPLGALKHSKDAGCLMDGRDGTIGGGTKERMQAAIEALGPKCRLTFQGTRWKHYADKTPEEQIIEGLVWCKRPEPKNFAPPATRKLAVVLYAFARPDYLEQVVRSLKQNKFPAEHIHVFVDGMINPWSGELKGDPAKIHECRSMIPRLLGRKVHLWSAACNYGVGLIQHFGMDLVFDKLKYDAALFLEDDLVLAPNYIETMRGLIPVLDKCPQLSAVQGGYRKTEGARKDDLLLLDAQRHHVHYWGWLTTRRKYKQIQREYDTSTAKLFGDVDYSQRNKAGRNCRGDELHRWFVDRDLPPTHKSQDWVRDGCFRRAGMKFKLVCAMRRSVPIGEWGLHSSPQLFRSMGLDASTDDLHSSALNLRNYRLLGPFVLRDKIGALPRMVTKRLAYWDDGGVDGPILVSTKPQAGPQANLVVGTDVQGREPRNTACVVRHDQRLPERFGGVKRETKGELALHDVIQLLTRLFGVRVPPPSPKVQKPAESRQPKARRIGRGRLR